MRALALIGLLLMPLASAGWSVPAGQGYEAERIVVLDAAADRSEIDADGGVVAWVENATDDGQRKQGRLEVLQQGAPLFRDDGPTHADAPSVGTTHVSWRDHTLATTHQVNAGSRIGIASLADATVRYHGAEGRVVTRPRLEGTTLTWGSYGVYPDQTREIHRLDLARGTEDVWPTPFDCAPDDVWPAGGLIVLATYVCGDSGTNSGTGGIFVWDPTTGVLQRHGASAVSSVAEGGRVVWSEYRAGEGRGTNLYVLDLALGVERRATFSEGRESFPSLSGELVAWIDTRSEDRGPDYTIYFEDLRTRNEYLLEGSASFSARPALDGRDLWYGDDAGRLVVARLPATHELLVADVAAALDQANTTLALTIEAPDAARVAWDADLDGTFETQGELRVPVEDGAPTLERVMGAAIDNVGRVSVMSVDVRERFTLASLARALSEPPTTSKRTPAATPTEAAPTTPALVVDQPRTAPLAAAPIVVLALALAARRRP